MNSLAAELEAHRLTTARSLAKRDKLIDDAGTVWCWQCDAREALMPSLHCAHCLADSHRRSGRVAPQCVNREQTDADRAAALALRPDAIRQPRVPRVSRASTFASNALPPEK